MTADDANTEPQQSDDQQNKGDAPDSPPQRVKRKRHPLISLLRFVLVCYIAMLILMAVMEPTLVFPGAYGLGRPEYPGLASHDLKSEPWEYPASDGSTIIGRLLERPDSARTILYLHGNGVKAVMLDDWIERLSRRLNANVLAAEYRGFQDEDVTPHESNVIADALSAHDALCEHYQLSPDEVIVYGRSLGGGCAAAVAAERDSKTLILESTFDSAASVAAGRYPFVPIQWLMRNQFDSVQRLSGFKGRLIQIHGTPDTIVPIDHGKRLHRSVPSDKKVFLEIPDMQHNDHLTDRLLEKLDGLLGADQTER